MTRSARAAAASAVEVVPADESAAGESAGVFAADEGEARAPNDAPRSGEATVDIASFPPPALRAADEAPDEEPLDEAPPDEALDEAPLDEAPLDEAPLDEAMELIHFAFRRVVEAPDRVLEGRGMGRLHHRLLYVIGKNPRIDVTQTLELLGITKQAGHQPLRELVDADLVRVVRAEDDRRRKLLTLTPAGKRFERRLAHLQHRVFAEAFADAGRDAVEAWRVVMDRLGDGRRLRA